MSARASKRSVSNRSESLVVDEAEDDESLPQKPSKKARTKRVHAAPNHDYDGLDDGDDEDDEQVDESKVFETGQIIKIHVENFMCHRKFTMDFGRHLNFINGANGSGKSAIAGALQLCLGARASVTGRGSQIATYVRQGTEKHEYALVQVTLRNEGSDAYKKEIYGKRITIERKFNREGGSGGYVIKDEDMKIISRERKELQLILASFNIQVDNPCCVLTQEESKKFIQGNDKEKFAFFMRATGLATLSDELLDLIKGLHATEEEVKQAKAKQEDLKKDVKNWKDILQKLEKLEQIDVEINKCFVKIAWGKAENKCQEVRQSRERREGAEKELLEARSEAEKVTDEGIFRDKLQEISLKQQDLQGILDNFDEPIKTTRATWQISKTRMTDLSNQMREVKEHRVDYKRRLDEAEGKRQQLLDRRLKDAQSEERTLLEKADEMKSEVDSTKAVIDQLSGQCLKLQEQKASLQQRISSCGVDISNNTKDQQRFSKELRELTSGGNSAEQRIRRLGGAVGGPGGGDSAVKLVEKIGRESFRQAPLGPLGMYVNVQEGQHKWTEHLEKNLGGFLLSGYLVTNREDNIKLKTLMRSVSDKCNFTVYQQAEAPRYKVRSVSEIAASRGYNGLVCPHDLLQIQNDSVYNLVVDNANLESIAYWRGTDKQMEQELANISGNRTTFKYDIKSVLLEDKTTISSTNGLMSRTAHRDRFENKNMLVADSNAAIQALQDQLSLLEQELLHNQQQKQSLQNELNIVMDSIRDIEGKLRVSKDKLKVLLKKKQDLDGRLSEVQDSTNIDVSLFDNEIAELKAAIDQFDANIGDLKSNMEEEAKTEKVKKAAMKEMEQKKEQCSETLYALEEELKKTIAAQKSFRTEQAQLAKRISAMEVQFKAAAEELAKKEAEYEKLFEAAEFLSRERWPEWDGAPIPLTRKETISSLERQVNALAQEKNDSKKKHGVEDWTIPLAMERYSNASAAYEEKKEDILELQRRCEILNADMTARHKQLTTTKNRYQEIVRNQFESYLRKRNSTGTVRFDFKEQTMTMEVQTQKGDRNTKVSDVKNLSGGERSFATYCFLLALGHVIESSFRIMDEYDVFMDEVTRKETIKMMEEYVKAPEQQGRQFILLTPNNLSHVSVSNQVRVKKMPDPERHASAHGPQQQTLNFS